MMRRSERRLNGEFYSGGAVRARLVVPVQAINIRRPTMSFIEV